MELASQSVSDLFLAKGDLSLSLDHMNPVEIIGLGEGKLDLYVPSEAIIEPISPAEELPEESALAYEAAEEEIVQSNHSLDAVMPNEIIGISTGSDLNSCEAPEDFDPTDPGEMGITKEDARKSIPPKKDRMDPLKMDMSIPTVIPLTSSQLSLQCLECHIIFSDDKSKQRHLKMNHPTEYEQCMLGDALFACYVCDRHFTCSTELMAHQRAHTEKQPFKCPICGEAFSRSTELTCHKKIHYNKQGYTCSDCGKLYKTLTLLKYHQRIHTGEKPYVCLYKDCGKRFTMPKALQKHLEAHQNQEIGGVENSTNTPNKTKKRRSKGTATRKYACSQCNESFKTAKSQLHHNKIKHSQCSFIKSASSAVATGSPSLTEVIQLPIRHTEAIGPTVQQISPLGVEQIKKLIEKMGNVQKVNQLVILGLDQVPSNQHPQGLIQQLHFDFTLPTVQQTVLQPAEDTIDHEGTASAGPEQDTLLESIGVEVSVEQKNPVVQDETIICTECPEKMNVIESDLSGAQVNGIQYELLPELTEKDLLPPELEASHKLILTTDMLQIPDAIDVKTPESLNNPSLTFITEFESRMASEKEFVINPTDITVSEKPCQKDSEVTDLLMIAMNQTVQVNVVNSDMTGADLLSQQPSEALGLLVEPEPQTGQEALDELDKTNAETESQCQEMMEATDSFAEPQPKTEQGNPKLDSSQQIEHKLDQQNLKEIVSSEDLIIKPSLLKPPIEEIPSLEEAPCSESVVQQSSVKTDDQIPLAEDSLYIKKVKPIKKKTSKKQLKKQSKYFETQDEASKTLPITPNQKIVSKAPKKQEKTKKLFGPKQNKKKNSKPKLLNISKNSLHQDQQDIDPGNVPVVSHSEMGKLKQKHKKGRKAGKSAGLIQALSLPCEQKLMKVSEQAHRGKPRKRKFENQRDLVKKGKSAQETQQDETPVPKKKKPGKIPEAIPNSQKKAKTKVTVKKVNKKSHKLAKRREKDIDASDTPIIDQIKEQALLLLKGHKQPQLKVHKLDAKTTGLDHQLIQKCQTKEIYGHEMTAEATKEGPQSKSPSQKKKKTKTMGRKSKGDSKQATHLQSSPVNSDLLTPCAKQKVARKRKAPVKIDQEIALSPPYSRLIIGCHDCGKSFSEVSALQEHMASMHSGQGAPQSIVPCDTSEMPTVSLRPNEIMLTNSVHSSSFEIHVPTDWDVESEMREIGLGDEQRNEHRLSFPALNPSPSFPMTTPFVEVEGKQDEAPNHEAPVRLKKAAGKNSVCCPQTNETNPEEQETMKVPSLFPASVSEPEKSMEGNLITVEAQEEGESQGHKVSDAQEMEASHTPLSHIPPLTPKQLSTSPVNAASTSKAESHLSERSEIKQEADEVSVQTVASQTHTSMTRGRRGRGNKGRGRRQLGKRRSAENKHPAQAVASEEDCQVVFELYSLTGNAEENSKEIVQNRKAGAVNATASSPCSASTESSEVQEVCVLPQPVTSSASEMKSKNSSLPGEHDKNCSLRKRRISVQCQSETTGQGNLQSEHGLTSAGTSTDMKMEVSPSVQTPHDDPANDGEFLQEVQMILVKAEDQHISNDPHILQEAQHIQLNHSACQEKHLDRSTVGISSDSPTATQLSTAKQCIFYPVKEEEGEMLVEPQANNQRTSGPEESTGPCGTAGLEQCEIRIGCPQIEVHHNIYSSTEECNTDSEQRSTEDILEFLSQTSDTEDSEGVHSEPEAETHIMSCYRGIYANGAVRPCEMASAEQCAKNVLNTSCPEVDDQQTGRKERCEPIDYFIQYFSWNVWNDIAVCTGQGSKLANPVTKEEVAQFVGIHIAMGTLKFPSMKLYWDDFTRVPLIADAMSAVRFTELASNLRLASREEDGPNMFRQIADEGQGVREALVSKKDPLWKVQAIVNRVREGCQVLQRNGNYGVDQYLLPFQRHPTHSLHHTAMINAAGLVMDFSLRVNDCNREEIVERMVSQEKGDQQGMVFLCKPELSTPSMLEHLLEAGVRSAGKVGGARGQIGDEFVTSDGKLKLFRCHHGFILSAVTKEKSRSTSLVSGFERAIKAANLNRDLRNLYRTPCTSPLPSSWPQSVLWDLIDLALVNSWLQYNQDQKQLSEPLSLMAFRLDVSKALIRSTNIAVQDSSAPYLPPPTQPRSNASTGHSDVFETPLPDAATRFDGLGHWPEQLSEGEEARCRFGGCEQMSRVRCLKCCVFLCISRNHNCFLKFHSQGTT